MAVAISDRTEEFVASVNIFYLFPQDAYIIEQSNIVAKVNHLQAKPYFDSRYFINHQN